MSYTPDEKVEIVSAWFNEIEGIIGELKKLSTNEYYKQISIPTLYTLLERMAWFRYRRGQFTSSTRFKELLQNYSEVSAELKKIDLAFLYQWDNSEYCETQEYKKAIQNIHKKIKLVLSELYTNISITMENRFIDLNILHKKLLEKNICSDCLPIEKLKLFSAYEVIYRFGRCKAAHEGEFVAVGFINADFLILLTENIAKNLKKSCLEHKKLADEL